MIDRLARVTLAGVDLALRRAWPRSADHLLLEYRDDEGAIVPGQWWRDGERLGHVAGKTAASSPGAAPTVVEGDGARVLLQPGGADRRLVGLSALVARDGARLVSHRPERRAVVRLNGARPPSFAKVVRPPRVPDLLGPIEYLASLEDRPFSVPEVREVNGESGVVTCSVLAGRSLHEQLADSVPAPAAAAGEILRWLHDAPPLPAAPVHDAAAEVRMLGTVIDRLAAFVPDVAQRAGAALGAVVGALEGGTSPHVVVHRDFHDKQVFVPADGPPGLLDFDTLGVGEAALDVANMLVHLELRGLQGLLGEDAAAGAARAFADGYRPAPGVRDRLPAYVNATRLRLACLYALRPQWAGLPAALLERTEGRADVAGAG